MNFPPDPRSLTPDPKRLCRSETEIPIYRESPILALFCTKNCAPLHKKLCIMHRKQCIYAQFSVHFLISSVFKNSIYVKPTSHKPPSNKDPHHSINTKQNLAHILNYIN